MFEAHMVCQIPFRSSKPALTLAAAATAVIEFIFLADPPLMFWNLAAAVGQQYWLLPVPQAYWMQKKMQVGHRRNLHVVALGGICVWGEGCCGAGLLPDTS